MKTSIKNCFKISCQDYAGSLLTRNKRSVNSLLNFIRPTLPFELEENQVWLKRH